MVLKPPAVSVVIPTYNRCAFLREAVGSVLGQMFEDFELIVVDDGSTDATRDAVISFDDPRVRYLFQANQGVAAARNWGAASSRGGLIAFLDSDDVWLPDKLRVQVSHFDKHPGVSICQTEEIWIRKGVRVNPAVKHRKHSGWIFRECIPLCIVSPSAVMLRREAFDALGGFDETLPACEDYDLWLRASLRYEIHTLPEALIEKRGGHADQLSGQPGLDGYRIRALQKVLGDPLVSDEDRRIVEGDIVRRANIIVQGARKRGNLDLVNEFEALASGFQTVNQGMP